MLRSATEVLLRVHERSKTSPEFQARWGQALLDSELRFLRRWLATDSSAPPVHLLTGAIRELQRTGITISRDWRKRILYALLGLYSERLIMTCFRWFKPKTFANYTRLY